MLLSLAHAFTSNNELDAAYIGSSNITIHLRGKEFILGKEFLIGPSNVVLTICSKNS